MSSASKQAFLADLDLFIDKIMLANYFFGILLLLPLHWLLLCISKPIFSHRPNRRARFFQLLLFSLAITILIRSSQDINSLYLSNYSEFSDYTSLENLKYSVFSLSIWTVYPIILASMTLYLFSNCMHLKCLSILAILLQKLFKSVWIYLIFALITIFLFSTTCYFFASQSMTHQCYSWVGALRTFFVISFGSDISGFEEFPFNLLRLIFTVINVFVFLTLIGAFMTFEYAAVVKKRKLYHFRAICQQIERLKPRDQYSFVQALPFPLSIFPGAPYLILFLIMRCRVRQKKLEQESLKKLKTICVDFLGYFAQIWLLLFLAGLHVLICFVPITYLLLLYNEWKILAEIWRQKKRTQAYSARKKVFRKQKMNLEKSASLSHRLLTHSLWLLLFGPFIILIDILISFPCYCCELLTHKSEDTKCGLWRYQDIPKKKIKMIVTEAYEVFREGVRYEDKATQNTQLEKELQIRLENQERVNNTRINLSSLITMLNKFGKLKLLDLSHLEPQFYERMQVEREKLNDMDQNSIIQFKTKAQRVTSQGKFEIISYLRNNTAEGSEESNQNWSRFSQALLKKFTLKAESEFKFDRQVSLVSSSIVRVGREPQAQKKLDLEAFVGIISNEIIQAKLTSFMKNLASIPPSIKSENMQYQQPSLQRFQSSIQSEFQLNIGSLKSYPSIREHNRLPEIMKYQEASYLDSKRLERVESLYNLGRITQALNRVKAQNPLIYARIEALHKAVKHLDNALEPRWKEKRGQLKDVLQSFNEAPRTKTNLDLWAFNAEQLSVEDLLSEYDSISDIQVTSPNMSRSITTTKWKSRLTQNNASFRMASASEKEVKLSQFYRVKSHQAFL